MVPMLKTEGRFTAELEEWNFSAVCSVLGPVVIGCCVLIFVACLLLIGLYNVCCSVVFCILSSIQ